MAEERGSLEEVFVRLTTREDVAAPAAAAAPPAPPEAPAGAPPAAADREETP
jgi:hypothetical protein